MKGCDRCNLSRTRTQVVLPTIVGDPLVCFLGEAPGKTEDLKGKPFVGAAGNWHDSLIRELGIYDDYMVTNVINCRPTKQSEKGNTVNGKPNEEQIASCKEWRNGLLLKYDFKLLILYGKYPIEWAVQKPISAVGDYVGKFYSLMYPKQMAAFAMYHPATLVYNKSAYMPEWKKHISQIKTFFNNGAVRYEIIK